MTLPRGRCWSASPPSPARARWTPAAASPAAESAPLAQPLPGQRSAADQRSPGEETTPALPAGAVPATADVRVRRVGERLVDRARVLLRRLVPGEVRLVRLHGHLHLDGAGGDAVLAHHPLARPAHDHLILWGLDQVPDGHSD